MKSLLGGGGGEWWWQTKFSVSPGPGLWSFVLGPFGPDLGPDLDLTWDLDLRLTILDILTKAALNIYKATDHLHFLRQSSRHAIKLPDIVLIKNNYVGKYPVAI